MKGKLDVLVNEFLIALGKVEFIISSVLIVGLMTYVCGLPLNLLEIIVVGGVLSHLRVVLCMAMPYDWVFCGLFYSSWYSVGTLEWYSIMSGYNTMSWYTVTRTLITLLTISITTVYICGDSFIGSGIKHSGDDDDDDDFSM